MTITHLSSFKTAGIKILVRDTNIYGEEDPGVICSPENRSCFMVQPPVFHEFLQLIAVQNNNAPLCSLFDVRCLEDSFLRFIDRIFCSAFPDACI